MRIYISGSIYGGLEKIETYKVLIEALENYGEVLDKQIADPKTIEKELYTQDKVEEALEKIRKANKAEEDFNSSSDEDWGDVSDDDDEAWD